MINYAVEEIILGSWRNLKVTKRRAKISFTVFFDKGKAHCLIFLLLVEFQLMTTVCENSDSLCAWLRNYKDRIKANFTSSRSKIEDVYLHVVHFLYMSMNILKSVRIFWDQYSSPSKSKITEGNSKEVTQIDQETLAYGDVQYSPELWCFYTAGYHTHQRGLSVR